MTEWKYIDDYKALIYLLDALGSLARISLTGTTLPALTASVCEYAVNTNKIEQAKKLCSYQHLLWCVNEYCKKADNNPEAQKMAKECDFWECWLIIDDVRYWLTEIKHITLEEAPEEPAPAFLTLTNPMSKEELEAVFLELQDGSFISQQSKLENWLYIFRKADKAPAKFEKVIWCDTDSKTKQIIKLSLFDLLALLGVKEQSANRETMNKCFAVPTGCRFTANNYSWIDWQKIESQHHKQLVNIVEKAQKEALANKDNKIK